MMWSGSRGMRLFTEGTARALRRLLSSVRAMSAEARGSRQTLPSKSVTSNFLMKVLVTPKPMRLSNGCHSSTARTSFFRNEAPTMRMALALMTRGLAPSSLVFQTSTLRWSSRLSIASMCLPSGDSWKPVMRECCASNSTLGTEIALAGCWA
jgi:hypothetical protein